MVGDAENIGMGVVEVPTYWHLKENISSRGIKNETLPYLRPVFGDCIVSFYARTHLNFVSFKHRNPGEGPSENFFVRFENV